MGFSSCGSRALKRRLSSCGARALVAPQHVGFSWSRAQTCVPFFFKFIYFWLRCVFIAAPGLSLVAASGGFSCGARALGVQASVVVARGLTSCGSQALECRLSSCGARA